MVFCPRYGTQPGSPDACLIQRANAVGPCLPGELDLDSPGHPFDAGWEGAAARTGKG
jgi:hypothetical protein